MKPMMSDKEIQIISDVLKDLKPFRALEWGSGGSSCYFSRFAKQWLSVEHNGHWVQDVVREQSNAIVIWVPEDQWYIDCVKHSGEFDFILVDGLHRRECVKEGLSMLSENGVLLLHDAGREEYQDFIREFGGEMLIEGEEPYKGYYKHRGIAMFRL